MDVFVVALATLLTGLPAYYTDHETPEVRSARMTTVVAPAIDDVASEATCSGPYSAEKCQRLWPGSKKDLALLLVTKGFWESRFAVHVQAGKCGPRECDAYKDRRTGRIVHRAAGYFQVQANGLVPPKEWSTLTGLDYAATRRGAWAAAKVASAARKRCSRAAASWEMVTISAYARGNTCYWGGAFVRVKFLNKMRGQFKLIRERLAVEPAEERPAQAEQPRSAPAG